MTVTVPTWTLVLPMLIAFVCAVFLLVRYAEVRWIQPWVDRMLAKRMGVTVEKVVKARKEMRM